MLSLLKRFPIVQRDSSSTIPGSFDEYYDVLFQQLRTQLGNFDPPRAIGVTSCARGEGVSSVATHLALTAAQQMGQSVLLIEADYRRDRGSTLRCPPGLYDILFAGIDVTDCLQATHYTNIHVLGAGNATYRNKRYPKEAFQQLVQRLKADYSFIVVDLPHAHELTHCFAMCSLLDGVLLVVEAERVRSQVVRRSREQLGQADANLLGVVFNKRRNHVPDWLYRRL